MVTSPLGTQLDKTRSKEKPFRTVLQLERLDGLIDETV